MNPSPMKPDVQLYALRVVTRDAGAHGGLAGCVEHVLTGRRREFESGEALLALLSEGPATAVEPSPSRSRPARS
jgi:hypothetical protein